MWRKANRLAGAQLKHCKERGEWAELYFMMMAFRPFLDPWGFAQGKTPPA